jgi:hypothetical protein
MIVTRLVGVVELSDNLHAVQDVPHFPEVGMILVGVADFERFGFQPVQGLTDPLHLKAIRPV